MKICRFGDGRIGAVTGSRLSDITEMIAPLLNLSAVGDPLVSALPRILALPPEALSSAPTFDLDQVRLGPPVLRPGKIMAAPVNYQSHIAEMTDTATNFGHTENDIAKAGLFLKATSSLAGPSKKLLLRFPERRTDYEVELVAVIGDTVTDVSEDHALKHISGYTLGLDITLRGPEDRSFRKSIDGYSIIGPYLATAEEVPNPDDIILDLRVNGEKRQFANTADMIYGVAKLVSFASKFYTLHPGDLIFTGTPSGVGPVVPGDRIVAGATGLGALEIEVDIHKDAGRCEH
ncbi:MAG: fumarylacetoacetate hydrolase family protein [Alphaproteobacteria bacterium]|jgi:2,4-diketo-3-deoxy-L-fuconate hydrolase